MEINIKVSTCLEDSKDKGYTTGLMEQYTKASSEVECETVKVFGVLKNKAEMYMRDSIKMI